MSKKMITVLSSEQESLIPKFKNKWKVIDVSTNPVDQEQFSEMIESVYLSSGYAKPEILFYSSPLEAIQKVTCIDDLQSYLGREVFSKFIKRVISHLQASLRQQIDEFLLQELGNKIRFPLLPHSTIPQTTEFFYFCFDVLKCTQLQLIEDSKKLHVDLGSINIGLDLHRSEEWSVLGCLLDFCISVLEVRHDVKKWKAFRQWIQYCGFSFQYEKVCISCNRPQTLSFDQENSLHAEIGPALQFADGYSVYAHHGLHPSDPYYK